MSNDKLPFTSLLIDGNYRPSSTNATFPVIHSYNGQTIGNAASASSTDVEDAIKAAHRAFPSWESTPLHVRRDIFLRAADILDSQEWKQKAKKAIMEETSSAEGWALHNIAFAGSGVRNVAAMVNELKGDTFPSIVPGGKVFVMRRACGVVFSVIPWNGPVPLTTRGVAIPLICGNTVICKPSEYSPRIIGLMCDAYHHAGLPAGVLNFLPISREDAPEITKQIIAHPFVKKVTFTGSDRVGKIFAQEAARHLKPCLLELGGKAPAVVLEDADLNDAARGLIYGGLFHSGQICMSTERVIVIRSVLEPLLDILKKTVAEKITVGDPKTSKLSALFTEGSASNVKRLVKEASEKGAKVVYGGDGDDAASEGNAALVGVKILVGVKPGMELWERESFGPILSILPVDSVDEAVELANESEYSLTASLWTKDIYSATDVASRIRSGAVIINGPTVHSEAGEGHAGLGGSSGYGKFSVDTFTERRQLVLLPPRREYPLLGL